MAAPTRRQTATLSQTTASNIKVQKTREEPGQEEMPLRKAAAAKVWSGRERAEWKKVEVAPEGAAARVQVEL